MQLHRCYSDHLKGKLTQKWKLYHHLLMLLQTVFLKCIYLFLFFCTYNKSQCSPVLFWSPLTFIVWTETVLPHFFCCLLQKILQNDMIFGWTTPLRACQHLHEPSLKSVIGPKDICFQIWDRYRCWPTLAGLPGYLKIIYFIYEYDIILQMHNLACAADSL